MTALDQLTVGAWIRITAPVGYADERFALWQQITWLPPRSTWAAQITVGFADNTGRLRLDWPADRIELTDIDPSS